MKLVKEGEKKKKKEEKAAYDKIHSL